MVRLTFKNVGQGDSIILEWRKEDENKIGIIDCNIFETSNPILDHIKNNKVKCIDFIILTHPHTDHFSGFFELISYCRTNKIQIKRFLHTALTTPAYLKSACSSREGKKELIKLFTLLKEMVKNGEIKLNYIEDNPDIGIRLNSNFSIEILSPSSIETDKYIRTESFPFNEEVSGNNSNANWLSTVLKLSNKSYSVLLTSDVEKSTLTRIGKKSYKRLVNSKVLIAQCPHHGSRNNLNSTFWQMRTRHEITPIVFSVGPNNYNHPSDKVIDFFNKTPNYKIYRTDNLNSPQHSQKIQKKIAQLDVFSTNVTATFQTKKSEIRFNLLPDSFLIAP